MNSRLDFLVLFFNETYFIMEEELEMLIEICKDSMNEAVARLKRELLKINTGKASPAMVSDILVNYYGSPTPLKQVANVSKSDMRTLVIQPWEKASLGPIEKSIFEANIGITPMNDGELIRLVIPPLTEERRKLLGKKAKAVGEEAKVSVRSARKDAMDAIKKAVKDGYPEDAGKREEDNIQEMTNNFGKKIDTLVAAKAKDIMTV